MSNIWLFIKFLTLSTNLVFMGTSLTTNGGVITVTPYYQTNVVPTVTIAQFTPTNNPTILGTTNNLFVGPVQLVTLNITNGIFTNPAASFRLR